MNYLAKSSLRSSLLPAALALALAALVSTPQAKSQEFDSRVNIPFSFESGPTHLDAGVYRIHRVTNHVIQLQGRSGGGFAMTITQSATKVDAPKKGRLVFSRYGDTYFLREIWQAGDSTHLECMPTSSEKRLQKQQQLASASPAAHTVETATLELPR